MMRETNTFSTKKCLHSLFSYVRRVHCPLQFKEVLKFSFFGIIPVNGSTQKSLYRLLQFQHLKVNASERRKAIIYDFFPRFCTKYVHCSTENVNIQHKIGIHRLTQRTILDYSILEDFYLVYFQRFSRHSKLRLPFRLINAPKLSD